MFIKKERPLLAGTGRGLFAAAIATGMYGALHWTITDSNQNMPDRSIGQNDEELINKTALNVDGFCLNETYNIVSTPEGFSLEFMLEKDPSSAFVSASTTKSWPLHPFEPDRLLGITSTHATLKFENIKIKPSEDCTGDGDTHTVAFEDFKPVRHYWDEPEDNLPTASLVGG